MKKNILVVEEDYDLYDALHHYFRADNFNIIKCESIKEALSCIDIYEIHLIISEHNLYSVNGLELKNYLKEYAFEIPLLIIAENKFTMKNSEEFSPYLIKPFDSDSFKKSINEAIY